MLDEDVGGVAGQHVTEHAAAHAGDHAHEGQQEDAVGAGYAVGALNADHGEYAQSDGVHQQHDYVVQTAPPLQAAPDGGEKDGDGGGDGNQGVDRVLKGDRGRDPQDQVPDHAAADGGTQTEDGDAKDIHALFQADHRTGCSKGDGANQFQNEEKGLRHVGFLLSLWDGKKGGEA